MYTEAIMRFVSIIGVIAFAISGAMVAVSKKVDAFGVAVLAVITATGGGIMRDVLLGVCPPNAFTDRSYVFIAIITALIVFLAAHLFKDSYLRREQLLDSVNNVADALGLGVFAVSGTLAAIDYGFSDNGFLCVFVGMITGIGGGFLRDIMVQEIPFILKKRIYALAALAGSIIFYILYMNGLGYTVSAGIGAAATFFLRIFATHFRWNLPTAY